jgi:hypothetical protein
MTDFCQCGIPKLEGDLCTKCNKNVSPERIRLLKKSQAVSNSQSGSTGGNVNSLAFEPTVDEGTDAAHRVFRYGTLFEKIGSLLQIVNSIATVLLAIFLFIARPEGMYLLLGLLIIGVIWCVSYLQTSFIRGLASYFQMRSVDFLERRKSL